jgi:regulator of protease activity HflC (stomatin/prohibitin superfamily)
VEDLIQLLPVLAVAALIIFSLVGAAVKVVQEYERGVIFRLGRLVGAKGPGLFFIIPFIDRMVKIDLRTVTLDIPSQEAITRDNVTVRVNAVAYFRVVDPEAAVVRIENYMVATMQIAQTTMRSVLGQSELDELLSKREEINQRLQQIIDEQTEPWGIKVSVVEVKDVELPQTMQRAMARQAEAERDKRAKVIHAEGEFLAAEQLSNAANIISAAPSALQLRYLQTLSDISSAESRTIIFPLPMDLISAFMGNRPDESGAAGIKPVVPPPPGSEPAG